MLAELTAELASLKQLSDQPHTKRACELRAATARTPRRAPRASFPSPGRRCAPPERLNGKFVVHSNDDALHAEDLALGSKQLVQVEQAWRTLKSGLNLRVVFHWAPHRIHAHVALSVLSLLLERVAEHACQDTWRNIRDDLKQIKLAQLSSPRGEVWQVTVPRLEAHNRLKSLKIKKPPEVLQLT